MKNHLHVEYTFLDSSGSYKLTKQTSFSDSVKQIHTDICASPQKYIPSKKKIQPETTVQLNSKAPLPNFESLLVSH